MDQYQNKVKSIRNIKKIIIFKDWFFSWGWIVTLSLFLVSVFGFIVIFVNVLFQESNASEGSNDYTITGGLLNENVLSWESDVKRELINNDLDPNEWLLYILGIIQVESNGDSESKPDIMQASESIGLPPNSITSPEESIKVGVMTFATRLRLANELGISDQKSILQAYNFGTNYLLEMSKNNQTIFDIEFAEKYSKEIVFPAVTGLPSSSAKKQTYNAKWSIEIGKPYYWKNGGNFHYPNAVYYYIAEANLTPSDFNGEFRNPYFDANYVVTSEFGMRVHPITGAVKLHAGIDLVAFDNKTIRAIRDGVVVESIYHPGWGNYVVVDHGLINNQRYYSLYAHMRSKGIDKGKKVSAGDIIGVEGTTGGSTGTHLHLEIIQTEPNGNWSGAKRINPREVITFK